MINYQNLFLKTGNPIIDILIFKKILGTLYDLLIHLLTEERSTLKEAKERGEMKK